MALILQAGGVVCRSIDGSLRFLLVRAKQNPTHWIFPKGHIEVNETAEAAAVREVEEEAGIRARVLQPLGELEFPSGEDIIHVEHYLLQFTARVGAGEKDRQPRWCDYREAIRLLTFESSKALLNQAVQFMDATPEPME